MDQAQDDDGATELRPPGAVELPRFDGTTLPDAGRAGDNSIAAEIWPDRAWQKMAKNRLDLGPSAGATKGVLSL